MVAQPNPIPAATATTLRERAANARAQAACLLRQAAADEAAGSRARALPDPAETAARFDVAAMRLDEIQALWGVSHLVSDVCVAISCQPRAEADTPAGLLVEWAIETVDAVARRCAEEAANREPEWGMADVRLRIIADRVIANSDPGEMTALARDILVEAGR